jgi:hypothetical protein
MLKGQLFCLTHPFNAPAPLIPGIYRKQDRSALNVSRIVEPVAP